MPTSTRYVRILATQQPFSIGPDEKGRDIQSCNFIAEAQKELGIIILLEEQIAKLLEDNTLGTIGTDLFLGKRINIPTDQTTVTQIIDTGGAADIESHDDGEKMERRTFQILVRSSSPDDSTERARNIRELVNATRDTFLST